MSPRRPRRVQVSAFAKINLTLRVLGRHDDGYHELRTVFQSIRLFDRLTATAVDGPFGLRCSHPGCPSDSRNLVWRAAEQVWRAAGRRGAPRGAQVTLEKAIPLEAGLGGGSSDAAAALRLLADLWGLRCGPRELAAMAARVGADVPFFLQGGTALGVGRGDTIFPLEDVPSRWLVIAKPAFGVSTADAYRWFDEGAARPSRAPGTAMEGWGIPASELVNDLQAPVTARHPTIGRLVRALGRRGASYAAMSGSGSAVFGLFPSRAAAAAAARGLGGKSTLVLVTRTLGARGARVAARLRH